MLEIPSKAGSRLVLELLVTTLPSNQSFTEMKGVMAMLPRGPIVYETCKLSAQSHSFNFSNLSKAQNPLQN